jgi:hypothetical protein
MMICRLSAGISLLALCALGLAPHQAWAQAGAASGPVVVGIQGPCVLTLSGRPSACAATAYMVFPDSGRIAFTALSGKAGWAFSGETDHREGGRYILDVDSMISPSAARVEAQGRCMMDMAADGHTVRDVDCRAQTPAGVIALKASGVAQRDDGDDDDEDEDGGSDGPGAT